jgi:hypothetical protein
MAARSSMPTIAANILPGGMYQWRTGNDTITRERFGLEHSFALDSLLADNVKWSLNHQIAKTDQSTEEFYYPMSAKCCAPATRSTKKNSGSSTHNWTRPSASATPITC